MDRPRYSEPGVLYSPEPIAIVRLRRTSSGMGAEACDMLAGITH